MKSLTVDELIHLNNEKRKLLTEENEVYYTDLLIYLRTQWRLSEQQTEEILMEMLDHLLDAQNEGKSAKDIFGEEPIKFADSLIKEISNEDPRNWIHFIVKLVIQLLGWILIIRGAILFTFSLFTEINESFNLLQVSVTTMGIILFIILNIWSILNTIKNDLFIYPKEKKRERMANIRVGLTAGLSMLVLLLAVKFTPEIGPTIQFPKLSSFIAGCLLLLIHFLIKKYENNKKK